MNTTGLNPLITQASLLLQQGELVAFPTETVYGLGADATNLSAIEKLYQAKGRPSHHPVIVHIAKLEQLTQWASSVPDEALRLADAFWPGPLTMILPKLPAVLNEITGNQPSVGVRMPSHPIARQLLSEFGRGVVAPSANKFGRLSPTTAQDVRSEFGSEVSMVLDGGACDVGIESTIIDLSRARPRVLRPGMIGVESLAKALDLAVEDISGTNSQTSADESTRAPGGLPSHYAPRTKLMLLRRDLLEDLLSESAGTERKCSVLVFEQITVTPETSCIIAENDPVSFARSLYSNLRKLDNTNGDLILVQSPPDAPSWDGIRDRLERAAADSE